MDTSKTASKQNENKFDRQKPNAWTAAQCGPKRWKKYTKRHIYTVQQDAAIQYYIQVKLEGKKYKRSEHISRISKTLANHDYMGEGRSSGLGNQKVKLRGEKTLNTNKWEM
jgi:hypothetical protein